MLLQRSADWLTARVGDELVMMRPEQGKYIGLSETGSRVWELLDEPRTAEEICNRMCREYDISPADCRAELDAFVQDLQKHEAIIVSPD